MTPGTIVYLCWYDFQKQTEHICKGEVVDNELWAGTKQTDMINVSFQPPGMSGPIQHHFTADKLSEDAANVPHDDCYLVCGKKTRFFEHDIAGKLKKDEKLNASDAWQQVQQFKTEHWDYEHGHLQQEYLNEFYQLWHDAIAAKLGVTQNETPLTIVPCAEATPQPTKKLTTKQKRSTGAIQYQDSIQTSLFE